MRLYAHSLNRATDNCRSFIAAWSALEILIGKIFPIYQGLLAAELRKGEAKHNLADKFSVISMFLDDEGQPDEIEKFRVLKEVRDRLFHGGEISEESLPTGEVQRFFDKYFRNLVRRDA